MPCPSIDWEISIKKDKILKRNITNFSSVTYPVFVIPNASIIFTCTQFSNVWLVSVWPNTSPRIPSARLLQQGKKMNDLLTENKVQLYFTEMNSRYFKHCNSIFVNNYLLTGNKVQLEIFYNNSSRRN